ncbi:MAG: L,D-transpeptidase [Oligoflexia bacterium]|nr:L,D-transpeptidase [Oligoflexia bacterium]
MSMLRLISILIALQSSLSMAQTPGIGVLLAPPMEPAAAISAPKQDDSLSDLIGVDFRDIADFAKQRLPEAAQTLWVLRTYPHVFLGKDWKDDTNPQRVSTPVFATIVNSSPIYGMQLYQVPEVDGTKKVLPVFFMFGRADGSFVFRKLRLNFEGPKLKHVDFVQDYNLSQTNFVAKIGLLQRKLILEDAALGLKMVYPLGVGGLDDITIKDQAMLLTPVAPYGSLEKKWMLDGRSDKEYYLSLPFVRVSTSKGNYTPIGIHIQQNWPKFIRGFDSHGCMRLREKDLQEFHSIVRYRSGSSTPLSILYMIDEYPEHPYPLSNKRYKKIANYGTADKPAVQLDKDNLVEMVSVKGALPMDKLLPQSDPRVQVISALTGVEKRPAPTPPPLNMTHTPDPKEGQPD